MAANALDTLRLIGKTLVVEYNAKTPSRLKVREERREAAAGESTRETRGSVEIDGHRSSALLFVPFGGSLLTR